VKDIMNARRGRQGEAVRHSSQTFKDLIGAYISWGELCMWPVHKIVSWPVDPISLLEF
jgi:hypothetical protein